MTEKSSAEIKRELQEMSENLPEAEGDDRFGPMDGFEEDGELYEAEDSEVAEGEEAEEEAYTDPDSEIYESLKRKQELKQEEKERRQAEYWERAEQKAKAIKENSPEAFAQAQQFQYQMADAFRSDISDLSERYGEPLVAKFTLDVQSGKLKVPRVEESPNAVEETFLRWLDLPKVARTLTSDDYRAIIEAAQDPPLVSKFRNLMFPQHVPPPKPKAKPKPREKRYKMPEFTGDDVNEMVMDFFKKYPERFSGE